MELPAAGTPDAAKRPSRSALDGGRKGRPNASVNDVVFLYNLVLGRDPEGDAAIRNNVGRPIEDLLHQFLTSPEFLSDVLPHFARGEILVPPRPTSEGALAGWANATFATPASGAGAQPWRTRTAVLEALIGTFHRVAEHSELQAALRDRPRTGRTGTTPGSESITHTLLISILSFGHEDRLLALLQNSKDMLFEQSTICNLFIKILIRDNFLNPRIDAIVDAAKAVEQLPHVEVEVISGHHNLGFGGGHNANYRSSPADFMLILNDDIALPNLDWLQEAISRFDSNDRLALIGCSSNPRTVTPFFANGINGNTTFPYPLRYAEASILLVRGSAFEKVGMFDDTIKWAMFEDADLSFQVQSSGYEIDFIDMPHEHWRSTSVNSLPAGVKNSIIEWNRSRLFAKWNRALHTGKLGTVTIFDIWSDGAGDVFCALPHVLAELDRLPSHRRSEIVINTSKPDLVRPLLPEDVKVTHEQNVELLCRGLSDVSSLRSMRPINYSLPFNIHSLIAAALSVRHVGSAGFDGFAKRLGDHVDRSASRPLPEGPYAVLHVEFERPSHAGRGLPADKCLELLDILIERQQRVVLVGNSRQWAVNAAAQRNRQVTDLSGALSMPDLMAVIRGASAFVGIDSLPSHIAQALRVPCALFFGSVHPLMRVWDLATVWPITAELPCIGCYHHAIESSVPFCMRRDEACSVELSSAAMRQRIDALFAGTPHDWSQLKRLAERIQSDFVHLFYHHPAPPHYFIRGAGIDTGAVSNLIYQIIDGIVSAGSGHFRNAYIADLEQYRAKAEHTIAELRLELARRGSGRRGQRLHSSEMPRQGDDEHIFDEESS